MKYYKLNNDIEIEITKEEYLTILAELQEKSALAKQVYNGEITMNDVPEEWREEIQRRVDERKACDEANKTEDISDAELANILEKLL